MSLIGEAFVRIRPDDTGFRAEATKQVKRDLAGVDRSFSSSNREIGRFSRGALVGTGALRGLGRAAAFASASFIGGAGIIVGLKSASEAASNLNEQTSKSAVVFGKSQDAIVSWSKTSATALGLASDQAIQAAAGFGALLRPLGETERAAAENSKRLTQLAADLASFSNTSVSDALQALSSGLVGEIEPLRRYGVVLSEAAVQQKALSQTGKDSVKQLTAQEKVAARLAIIFDKTKQAQGDFARTAGSLANQQRTLGANLRNLAATVGEVVNPVLLDAITRLNKFLADPANQQMIQEHIQGTADKTKKAVGILERTFDGAKTVAHDFASALNSIDHALGGGKPNRDDAEKALEKEIQAYKTLIELQKSSLSLQNERNPAQGLDIPLISDVNIPSRVKGHGFVGRPLTAAEQLDILLASRPDDVQALQAKRAQYQRGLDYAKAQVAAGVGNTRQWAKDIEGLAGDIEQINSHLAQIATDKAAKAAAARLKMIDALIPDSLKGGGFAGGAFAKYQAAIARLAGGNRARNPLFQLPGNIAGLIQGGNIDINNRPVARNADGSISTVRSFSITVDGREILLPSVVNGRVVSMKEAIDHYFKTGQQLGEFSSVAAANAYAERLHNQQAQIYKAGFSGKGKADISLALAQSKDQQEASLRTQIAEQQVTNDKKLIPFLQTEAKLAQEHLSLLKKVGASKLAQLQEALNIATLRRRIREINKQSVDAFSIQDLFGEGGRQFAAYGSNVAPLNQPLSRQESGGAAVRAAQAGGKTIQIVQNFIGARDAGQAIQEASNAARALRY